MTLLSAMLSLILSTQAAAEPRAVTIAVDNTMKYSVTAIKAQPGETLRVVLQSKATMPKQTTAHNFVLLAQGTNAGAFLKAGTMPSKNTDYIAPDQKDRVIAATALAGPGETVEVTFKVPDRPGHIRIHLHLSRTLRAWDERDVDGSLAAAHVNSTYAQEATREDPRPMGPAGRTRAADGGDPRLASISRDPLRTGCSAG